MKAAKQLEQPHCPMDLEVTCCGEVQDSMWALRPRLSHTEMACPELKNTKAAGHVQLY